MLASGSCSLGKPGRTAEGCVSPLTLRAQRAGGERRRWCEVCREVSLSPRCKRTPVARPCISQAVGPVTWFRPRILHLETTADGTPSPADGRGPTERCQEPEGLPTREPPQFPPGGTRPGAALVPKKRQPACLLVIVTACDNRGGRRAPNGCRLSNAAAAAGGAEPVPTPARRWRSPWGRAGPAAGPPGGPLAAPPQGYAGPRAAGTSTRGRGRRRQSFWNRILEGRAKTRSSAQPLLRGPARSLGEAGGREPLGAGPAARGRTGGRCCRPRAGRGPAWGGLRGPPLPPAASPSPRSPSASTRNGTFPAETAVFLVPFPAVSHASEFVIWVHRPRQSLKTEAAGCFPKMAGKNKYP